MTVGPQLAGRVAVVTGGSRGIGLATASALMTHGVDVTICGRGEESLRAARLQIERVPGSTSGEGPVAGRLETLKTDVRDAAQVQRVFDATVERFGGLDILVNNAGVGGFSEVAAQSPDEWRQIIDTNLTGVFYCCQAAIPLFRRRRGGWIINISSLAGQHPFARGAAYCASKAGLNAFSEALMQEVRYDDIRVSSIMPGSVDTKFGAPGSDPSAAWKLSPADVAQVVIDLLSHPGRCLPSRVEMRPTKPRK